MYSVIIAILFPVVIHLIVIKTLQQRQRTRCYLVDNDIDEDASDDVLVLNLILMDSF